MIGRKQRDYLWIMARTPTIPDADYRKLIELAESLGYSAAEIRKVPQQWQ
jgi:apolipoprotein D and lipocalin family protein